MKKFILLSIFFLTSCGSDSPLVGRWKHVLRGANFTATEICEFNKNNIENCTTQWVQRVKNGTFEAHRLQTQEWTLANGQLTEKTTNGQILWMSLNGQEISPSVPYYDEVVADLTPPSFRTGYTITRKIELHEDYFVLFGKNGKAHRYDRLK